MSNYSKAYFQELRKTCKYIFDNTKTEDQLVVEALKRKIRLNKASMEDLEIKQAKRDSKPIRSKYLGTALEEGLATSAGIISGVATYLVANQVQPEASMASAGFGALAGYVAGNAGVYLYENRPVSKAVYEIATWANRRKYDKLAKETKRYAEYLESHYGKTIEETENER